MDQMVCRLSTLKADILNIAYGGCSRNDNVYDNTVNSIIGFDISVFLCFEDKCTANDSILGVVVSFYEVR